MPRVSGRSTNAANPAHQAWAGRLRALIAAHGPHDAPLRLVREAARKGRAAELADVYDAIVAHGSGVRTSLGAFYTPRPLIDEILSQTLALVLRAARRASDPSSAILSVRVCDPACGAGAFLVAAREMIARTLVDAHGGVLEEARRTVAERCLFGIDIDRAALALCAARLGIPRRNLRHADALRRCPGEWLGSFSVVVGNPPFLGQLRERTTRSRVESQQLRTSFGNVVKAYTDPAWLFLLQAMRLASPGGRVSLVEPMSMLTAEGAAEVRRACVKLGSVVSLWSSTDRHFEANVYVCAPTLVRGTSKGKVKLRTGLPARAAGSVAAPGEAWAGLLSGSMGVPIVRVKDCRTIGSIARATADFRDQFYGVAAAAIDDADEREGCPPIITSGLIEPARSLWGLRPTRISRRAMLHPRARLDLLSAELASWAAQRLKPKVLVATQTPAIEAAVDEEGRWLPITPVITVLPNDAKDLWLVAAALMSPVALADAATRFAGAALSPHAIKLSASQTMTLPIPSTLAAWRRGAAILRRIAGGENLWREFGLAMLSAHHPTIDERLLAWWFRRIERSTGQRPGVKE